MKLSKRAAMSQKLFFQRFKNLLNIPAGNCFTVPVKIFIPLIFTSLFLAVVSKRIMHILYMLKTKAGTSSINILHLLFFLFLLDGASVALFDDSGRPLRTAKTMFHCNKYQIKINFIII